MSRLDQFNALMSYIEENPQILAEHGERGTQSLRRIEEACLAQDAEALSDGIGPGQAGKVTRCTLFSLPPALK